MALTPLHLLSLIFFLVLVCPIVNSIRDLPTVQKHSPYDFLDHLQGCHKGNSTKGLHKLKHYLQRFGYLKYQNQTELDDDFDNALESALKTYQQNYHITPTGALDAATVSKMSSPRCGVPDIIDGVNTMPRKNHLKHGSKSIHNVADFRFFPNSPRWPSSQTSLTYRFLSRTRTDAMELVANAFKKWEAVTHFSFSQVDSNEQSDLTIGFFSGDHGDNAPFDGPGGTLAHAFAPTDGRFHYDAEENWASGAVVGAFDMETVALHEIGHLLGLGHSELENAIMYAQIPPGVTKNLDQDDIEGIRTLYNA